MSPSDYERTEQGDDPTVPTVEQLRAEMERIERDSDITALRARVAQLEAALRSFAEGTKWKSIDKDNMEFEGRINCYQLDKARAALKDAPQ